MKGDKAMTTNASQEPQARPNWIGSESVLNLNSWKVFLDIHFSVEKCILHLMWQK